MLQHHLSPSPTSAARLQSDKAALAENSAGRAEAAGSNGVRHIPVHAKLKARAEDVISVPCLPLSHRKAVGRNGQCANVVALFVDIVMISRKISACSVSVVVMNLLLQSTGENMVSYVLRVILERTKLLLSHLLGAV